MTGILFDAAGNRYTPTHAVKNGKRYRYYTSQAVIRGRNPSFPSVAGPVVPAPSNDIVHFRIKVDRSRCAANDPIVNARLSALGQNGLTLSIAQLVASANLHFAGSVQDERNDSEDARMRAAWNLLKGWNMTSEPHNTRPDRMVLVAADQPTSRMTAMRSEVLPWVERSRQALPLGTNVSLIAAEGFARFSCASA